MQPYEKIKQVADGLFCVDGEWHDTPFRRRMTIVRLKDGRLFIHNPFQMKDDDYRQIESLGEPAYIVAPNRFHNSEAHLWKQRYPRAKLWAALAAVGGIEKSGVHVDGVFPECLSTETALDGQIECFKFLGTRVLGEIVFYHRPSKTLILTDLVFNMRGDYGAMTNAVFKLNKIHHRFGPSRVCRWVFINDKKQARASLERILKWDFKRVIMNHGEVYTGGAQELDQSFKEIGV